MNNFDNKDNNHNSHGEYYVPPTPSTPQKKNGKGKKAAALAILIVVCVVLSSIGTALMISKVFGGENFFGGLNSNGQQSSGERPPASTDQWNGGITDSVTITKDPSDKVEIAEGSVGDKDMSVAQVVALVADSVVEVTTSSVQYDIFYGQQITSGAGSGVIFTRGNQDKTKYYIVTNHHVIEGAESISVRLRDGSEYTASLIGSDVVSDIGVLEIKSDKELTVAAFGNSDNLHVGEDIVVIGNPLGQLGGTVTNGIISALERKVSVEGLEMTLLQHNAAISPGNSGGGIFDTSGYLIGVVNAKSGDSSAEGLGFAIPINYAYEIIRDILNYGYVTGRAALPYSLEEYTSSNMFGATSRGVVVTSQNNDENVKVNDVVYSIDGTRVSTINELISLLADYKVGDTVSLQVARTVGRNVKLYTYDVTLVEYSPVTANY